MGFADALIAGEECFCVDIVSGEPVVYKPNMQNLYVIRSGDQTLIDDADIIVESSFKSIGQVVDEYYDYLKPDEIKSIELGMTTGGDNVTKHLSLTLFLLTHLEFSLILVFHPLIHLVDLYFDLPA